MRARYVIETRRWDLMAREERNFGNVNELFAIGVSAARSANVALAELARQGLADRAGPSRKVTCARRSRSWSGEVAALIDLAAGRDDRAVEMLRAADRAELSSRLRSGLPKPDQAGAELLGEVLLELGPPA